MILIRILIIKHKELFGIGSYLELQRWTNGWMYGQTGANNEFSLALDGHRRMCTACRSQVMAS